MTDVTVYQRVKVRRPLITRALPLKLSLWCFHEVIVFLRDWSCQSMLRWVQSTLPKNVVRIFLGI